MALVQALENTDDVPNPAPAHAIEVVIYTVAPPNQTIIVSTPVTQGWEDEATPSPDTVFKRRAEALYNAWISSIGRMNAHSFKKLNKEYLVNVVGNWPAGCTTPQWSMSGTSFVPTPPPPPSSRLSNTPLLHTSHTCVAALLITGLMLMPCAQLFNNARGRDHVSSSPNVLCWSGDTQEQEARKIMDEIQVLASGPQPTHTDQEVLTQLTAGASMAVRDWADDIALQRIGYSYYLQNGEIPPLVGGIHNGPDGSLLVAFMLTAATLGAGICDLCYPGSQAHCCCSRFYPPGSAGGPSPYCPIQPCEDLIQLPLDIPMPESQVELIQAMTGQLLGELSAQGVSKLSRPELWQEIYAQERDVLRQRVHTSGFAEDWKCQLQVDLQRNMAEEVLQALIATFKAQGNALKEQTSLAKRVAKKVSQLCAGWEADLDGLVEQEHITFEAEWRDDWQRVAFREAETEWCVWKDTELAKVKVKAMSCTSFEYVVQMCSDNAVKLVEEKRSFTTEYFAANYQAWVAQELENCWPQVEQMAQGYTRERYLQEELDCIWLEIWDKAQAKMAKCITKYKANLEHNLTKAADE
ncbi:hypothetical protein EDB85DRAFT_1897229 [Lactarius pseudohatsudake]|nr:hypothetical protein EDB85DRAFT_1897229 [Lactarius pseudohatsudake]